MTEIFDRRRARLQKSSKRSAVYFEAICLRNGNAESLRGLIDLNAPLACCCWFFFSLRYFFFPLQDNLSPLHVAAGMGHIDVTKRLLENGAHMEAEDNALYTPLWRAAYYGHPEVVEVSLLLLKFPLSGAGVVVVVV